MGARGTLLANPLQRLGSLRLAADETVRGIQMQARRIHADLPEDELYPSCGCRRETDMVFMILLLQRLRLVADCAAETCDDERLRKAVDELGEQTGPLGRLRNVLRQVEGYSSRPCDPASPALHWRGAADGSALFFDRGDGEPELVEHRIDVATLRKSAEQLGAQVVEAIERELAGHGC